MAHIDDKDLDLFEILYYRKRAYVWQLADILGRNQRSLTNRVKQLAEGGYIERIKNPGNYLVGSGSFPKICVLGNPGAALLEQERGLPYKNWYAFHEDLRTPPKSDENARRRVLNLSHEFGIVSTVAALYRASRAREMAILDRCVLTPLLPVATQALPKPWRWTTTVKGQKLGNEPDEPFAIQAMRRGELRTSYLFLEYDTGSEDVFNNDMQKATIWKKHICYIGAQRSKIHTTQLGFPNFRVLFLLPDKKRMDEIFRMLDRHKVRSIPEFNATQFLYGTHEMLNRERNVFDGWVNAKGQEVSLV